MENNIFNLGKEILEWTYTILIAIAIAFIIKTFIFDFVVVDGPSMDPTLKHRDKLIITKLNYKPQRQDIIVLDSTYKAREKYFDDLDITGFEKFTTSLSLPEGLKKKYYVKRIIGLPGDEIDLIADKVYVNGDPLDEDSYYDGLTYSTDPTVKYPITVDEGHIFVMGDNRDNSVDSRASTLGQVPIEAILGKCSLRILPLNSFGTLKH